MDEAAQRFTALYDAYYRPVLRYLLVYLDVEAAQDVASEAFLVAWRKLRALPERPLPWLIGIARNLRLKHRDRQHRQQLLTERLGRYTTAFDLRAWDAAELAIDRQAAMLALARLPSDDLELLMLTIWHGLDAQGAATVLGCTRAALAMRLHRARRRLQEALTATATESISPAPASHER
jgi:RNA polymerase sigma-70 factor (ECF subfamily)